MYAIYVIKKLGCPHNDLPNNHIRTEDFYKDIAGDDFFTSRLQTYSYLMDDGQTDKKAKGKKMSAIKRILKFIDYKTYLMNNKAILKSQQRFKREAHNVYTVKKSIRLH